MQSCLLKEHAGGLGVVESELFGRVPSRSPGPHWMGTGSLGGTSGSLSPHALSASATSLGRSCPQLIIPTVKKFFLISGQNHSWCGLCPLPLVFLSSPPASWLPSNYRSPALRPPWACSSQGGQTQPPGVSSRFLGAASSPITQSIQEGGEQREAQQQSLGTPPDRLPARVKPWIAPL